MPSVVTSRTMPPVSTLCVEQLGLKSSEEQPGDGVAGLKSSGLLEESVGGAWDCFGWDFLGLPADWSPCLPLSIRA